MPAGARGTLAGMNRGQLDKPVYRLTPRELGQLSWALWRAAQGAGAADGRAGIRCGGGHERAERQDPRRQRGAGNAQT